MLKDKVAEFHQLIIDNKTLEAIDKFYAPSVMILENDRQARIGKLTNLKNEAENLKKSEAVESQLLNVAINEQTSIVMSEWKYLITNVNGEQFLLEEISLQKWENELIIFERFYYEGIKPLKEEASCS